MTKEELRKEATMTVEWECTPIIDRPLFVHAYITGAEPREKRITELEKENACLKAGRPKWHKIFEDKPYYNEYWDLPQDRLPEIENFYFVKLKNGFIKICELKHDHWSRKKCFYDLNGGTQSNVAEWLDYPVIQGE